MCRSSLYAPYKASWQVHGLLGRLESPYLGVRTWRAQWHARLSLSHLHRPISHIAAHSGTDMPPYTGTNIYAHSESQINVIQDALER